MARLTVITLALNEEHNIEDCLASVAWADEIIVVDSGSTDRTVELARRFTDHVLSLEWTGYGPTKNAALERSTGEWILWLDADERVTPELAEEIRTVLQDSSSCDAYSVARRAYFLGRWMKHGGWYPGRVTRLFRKGTARFTDNSVHESVIVRGSVGRLRHDLLHFTDPDLHHYVVKFNRYTTLAARELWDEGRSASVFDLMARPVFMFFKMYLVRRGFLDGVHGFILSILSSAYVFTKYAKLWELHHTRTKG